MQVTIAKIFANQIQTKYGLKNKYDVYVQINGQEFKFQAWQGKWNAHWQIGTALDLPDFADLVRWEVNARDGVTFYTMKAPPEARQGGNNQIAPTNMYQPAMTTPTPVTLPNAFPQPQAPQPQAQPSQVDAKLDAINGKLDFLIEKANQGERVETQNTPIEALPDMPDYS